MDPICTLYKRDRYKRRRRETPEKNAKRTVYKNVYKGDTPWFVILGNHDYYGNPLAEILYSFKDSRWILPSNNYIV